MSRRQKGIDGAALAHAIQEALVNRGWTQAEFAKRMNVTQSTTSLWTTGNMIPSASRLTGICRLLDITPSSLVEASARSESQESLRTQLSDALERIRRLEAARGLATSPPEENGHDDDRVTHLSAQVRALDAAKQDLETQIRELRAENRELRADNRDLRAENLELRTGQRRLRL